MGLKWTDSLDIAIELDEKHPDIDPSYLNFVDLRDWIIALDDFDDDPALVNDEILSTIYQDWYEEILHE